MNLRAARLALPFIMLALPAAARDPSCPAGASNDACDRLRFEQMDRDLAQAVEMKLTDIGRRSTFADRVERARTLVAASQREWLRFRAAECEARAAVESLISARPLQGLTAQCLQSLTQQRIDELGRF